MSALAPLPLLRAPARGMGGHQAADAESHVWLTPRWIVDALGPFDLDPCAAPEPRPWPTAARHICPPENGLTAKWHGRVWLNPPYGPHVHRWLDRLAMHGAGVACVFARVETEAWRSCVWGGASLILFLAARPTFCRPDGRPARSNSGAPVALIAYGAEEAARLAASPIAGVRVSAWSVA